MAGNKENPAQIHEKLKRFFLEFEITNFYRYLKTLDEVLDTRKQELTNSIADINLDGIDKNSERRHELINLKAEAERVKGFTNLLRQSFLTSLYSFMELWLIRDCHLDSRRRDSGKSFKSTRGKGIRLAKNYFSKVIKSDYPFGTSHDWKWITNFQLLRDCIIHRQGSLTGHSNFEIDSTLAKFVNGENGLSLFRPRSHQVFIEREFCLTALQTIQRFMVELLSL